MSNDFSKVCPILNIGRTNQSQKCIKEDCEWWLQEAGYCSLKVIAYSDFSLRDK